MRVGQQAVTFDPVELGRAMLPAHVHLCSITLNTVFQLLWRLSCISVNGVWPGIAGPKTH